MRMPLRIIIPVVSPDETFERCLRAVVADSVPLGAEVVVVLNDGSSATLHELQQRLRDVPVLIRAHAGPRSAAATRNVGARDLSEGILVFVDADVLVECGAVGELIRPLQNGTASAAVGNYSRDVSGLTFAQAYKQLYVSLVYSRRTGTIRSEFWSALGAIDARVFHLIGGFDEDITAAGGEDTVLGYKMTRLGRSIVAVPQAQGKHLHRFTVRGLIENDFRKALRTLQNSARFAVPISANRHATFRDMLAVLFAVALLPATLLIFITAWSGAFLAFCSLVGYGWSRADLLRCAVAEGPWFATRSFGLSFLLDIVRAGAVFQHRCTQRFSRSLPGTSSASETTTLS